MNQKIDYAFIKPQCIAAENAKNIHIFEGRYNPITEEFVPTDKISCCGKCSIIPSGGYSEVSAEKTNDATNKKARQIAKDYEDCGITVCGKCVARLYSDEI